MQPETTPTRPYDAETLRKRLREFATHANPPLIPVGKRGAIIGWLNSIFWSDKTKPQSYADNMRHTALGWLFGDPTQPLKPITSKDLHNEHWYALDAWIALAPVLSPDGKSMWLPCRDAMTEALFLLHAALSQERKEESAMLTELGEDEL